MGDGVTVADYFAGDAPPTCWPRKCSVCGVWCADLAELTDEDHHEWGAGGR